MNETSELILSPEQVSLLARLAEVENTRLEDAASPVTHQAFNLGCLVGIVPGGIIVLLMYIMIGFSFIGAAMALVLMLIGLLAFANLAAMLARRNTIRRVYHDQSEAKIDRALNEAGLTNEQFNQIAHETLPAKSALFAFLPDPGYFANQETDPGAGIEN